MAEDRQRASLSSSGNVWFYIEGRLGLVQQPVWKNNLSMGIAQYFHIKSSRNRWIYGLYCDGKRGSWRTQYMVSWNHLFSFSRHFYVMTVEYIFVFSECVRQRWLLGTKIYKEAKRNVLENRRKWHRIADKGHCGILGACILDGIKDDTVSRHCITCSALSMLWLPIDLRHVSFSWVAIT